MAENTHNLETYPNPAVEIQGIVNNVLPHITDGQRYLEISGAQPVEWTGFTYDDGQHVKVGRAHGINIGGMKAKDRLFIQITDPDGLGTSFSVPDSESITGDDIDVSTHYPGETEEEHRSRQRGHLILPKLRKEYVDNTLPFHLERVANVPLDKWTNK